MPPNGQLRGQARRTRIQQNAVLEAIIRQYRLHAKECAICAQRGQDVIKRCDKGWDLAKQELRARRAIERYIENHEPKQERLF